MSISIHNYRTSHNRYANQEQRTASASTDSSRMKRTDADSIALSLDALPYLAQQQTPATLAAENAVDDKSEIGTDRKKTMLTNLQARLAENGEPAAGSGGEGSPLAAAISALTEQLSGFDADAATDEEVSALFDSVADTMDAMRTGGPPPMRMDGGGFPPSMQRSEDEGNAQTLADMKSMLAELQAKLEG
ncbi:hypothetical protein ACFFSY_12495 [Paenibacillus aurantiacus]|uniref:Uncharacterized protein n=1 Tax=Paenibacillus aurantiacus TaxID=1936118 RepID=A0ABV5KNF4_9BACL